MMNEPDKPKWNFFNNALIQANKFKGESVFRFVLVCLVILLIFYLFTPKEMKFAFFIFVFFIIIIVILFHFLSPLIENDRRKIKPYQEELSKQRIVFRKQKNTKIIEEITLKQTLLKDFITWDAELKSIFSMFRISDNIFVDKTDGSISLRNFIERNITAVPPFRMAGISARMTIRIAEQEEKIAYLINKKLVKKIDSEQNVPYTYRLELTEQGKTLNEILSKLDLTDA